MRELRGFVQEQVLDDDAFHRAEGCRDVLGVRVALGDVLAVHVQAEEFAVERGFKHVRDTQARFVRKLNLPLAFELAARGDIGHVPIARQLVREAAHVAGALHVVLASERIYADAFTADVAGGHCQIGDADHHRRALAVLGDAEAVVDRAITTVRIQPCRTAHHRRRHAGYRFHRLRRVAALRHEIAPLVERGDIAAFGDVLLLDQPFGDDHMGKAVDQRDVGAGPQLQVVVGLDVRGAHQIDAARVGDDQLRALTQAALHLRCEHRVAIGRVGADDDDDIGLHHRIEGLGAGRLANGLLQAIAGRRMADASASVDVVVAERGADHLLDDIDLLVGAAAGGDRADRAAPGLGLDALEFAGGVVDRFLPADLAPRIGNLRADHRLGDPVLVRRIADREAALDAGMAVVRVAILVRHHADDLFALHFSAERTADAAVGAGGGDAVLGLAFGDQRFLAERGGRAGGNAGAAGHAFRGHEVIVLARADFRVEAASLDRQRQRALLLVAGAHAARADDALARIKREIRIRFVLRHEARVGLAVDLRVHVVVAVVAVAHFAQADGTGHVLQFAVAIGRAGQAVQRVIGNVQLHPAPAQVGQLVVLGDHLHAVGNQCGARRRIAAHAFDLHQAQPAGAEGFQRIGRAELRDVDVGKRGSAHHRSAFRHRDLAAVDAERDLLCWGFSDGGLLADIARRARRGRAEILVDDREHDGLPLETDCGFACGTATVKRKGAKEKERTQSKA